MSHASPGLPTSRLLHEEKNNKPPICLSHYFPLSVEENNRVGKTRDLFKKIEDIEGTFHARMDTIKKRNSKDLTEAEEIKKRWQEYTELYKKALNDLDNHYGYPGH